MRFAVILPLLAFFVFFRAVWPVTVSLRWRVFWAVLLAAGALFPSVVVVVGGSMVASVLPEAVMVIGDYLELTEFPAGSPGLEPREECGLSKFFNLGPNAAKPCT